MTLKFDTSLAKRLNLKVRKFWGLSPTFAEATGEKLVWSKVVSTTFVLIHFLTLNEVLPKLGKMLFI